MWEWAIQTAWAIRDPRAANLSIVTNGYTIAAVIKPFGSLNVQESARIQKRTTNVEIASTNERHGGPRHTNQVNGENIEI